MNALRLFIVTSIVATLSTPIAGLAASTPDRAASCMSAPLPLVERRISENAAHGLTQLIGFVRRTQPIYQLTVEDAVAWIEAERERRVVCATVAARATD